MPDDDDTHDPRLPLCRMCREGLTRQPERYRLPHPGEACAGHEHRERRSEAFLAADRSPDGISGGDLQTARGCGFLVSLVLVASMVAWALTAALVALF